MTDARYMSLVNTVLGESVKLAAQALPDTSGAPNPLHQPDSKRFVFELWKQRIVGGSAVHAVVVVRDRETHMMLDKSDSPVLVMQGLATNRHTGKVQSIGMPQTDDIRAYAEATDLSVLKDNKNYERIGTLYQTNDPVDMGRRVVAMTAAAASINDGKYPYWLGGKAGNSKTMSYNSNSVGTTLIKAGGMTPPQAGLGGIAPGWGDEIPLAPAYAQYALPKTKGADIGALKDSSYNLTRAHDKIAASKSLDAGFISGTVVSSPLDGTDYFMGTSAYYLQPNPAPHHGKTPKIAGSAGTHSAEPHAGNAHKKIEIASKSNHIPHF